jgi:hypothetical protein
LGLTPIYIHCFMDNWQKQKTVRTKTITKIINFPHMAPALKTQFSLQSTVAGVVDFCCDDKSPDGRDVQARLTDQISARTMWAASFHFLYVLFGSIFRTFVSFQRPPLWYSGQSSWLQIQRFRFNSWCYQIWVVVGLELTRPHKCNWGATWKRQ